MSMNDHYVTREGALRSGELRPFHMATQAAGRRVAEVFDGLRQVMDDEVSRRVREGTIEVAGACDRRQKRLDYCEHVVIATVETMMASGRFTIEDVGLVAQLADMLASGGMHIT